MAQKPEPIEIDDELAARLDERSEQMNISRAHLVLNALEEFLAQDLETATDRVIVGGYTRIPPEEHDPWAEASGKRSIAEEPW